MKNKNFQILEIGTFQPLSVKFISEMVKDGGKLSKYYRRLSTQKQKYFKHLATNIVSQLLVIFKIGKYNEEMQ